MNATIAIVDENEAVLDAIRMMLESEGWRVWTFPSGEAFLEYFRHDKPDCMILDPHLHGVGGLEIAQSAARARIPIIGLTARPESAQTSAVKETGAYAIMTKPASAEELLDKIRVVIDVEGRV